MSKICGYSCEHNKGGVCQISVCDKKSNMQASCEASITNPKKQLEFYKQLSEQLQQENKKLKMINEEYERLNKENYRGFKIINVQEYDIYELLSYKNNWNKLKEYINKMHEYFLYTDIHEIYKQSMKVDNPFPHLFNLSELNASDRILSSICKKIQELEQGSDGNE